MASVSLHYRDLQHIPYTNKTLQHGIPSSKERGHNSSSLNVPSNYRMPIMILRLLCLIPATIGAYNNISRASSGAEYDDTGLFENKSTPLIHNVALLWVGNT